MIPMKNKFVLTNSIITIIGTVIMLSCIISISIKYSNAKNELSSYQSALSQIHITYLNLVDKNKKLETELANNKSKIQTLEENNQILSNKIIEYNEFLSSIEDIINNNDKNRLPQGRTNVLWGMSYRKITNTKSEQYALQQNCKTELETGLRYYDDGERIYYCVALGGAYGVEIGNAWEITLRNGSQFNVIHGDYKHDITNPDPNDFGDPCKNYDGEDCTNVLEMIFDDEAIPDYILLAGSYSKLDLFGGLYGTGGDIVKMEYIGRVWGDNK